MARAMGLVLALSAFLVYGLPATNVVDENSATMSVVTSIDGAVRGAQFRQPRYVAHIPHDHLFGKNLDDAAVTKKLPWSEGVGHFILTHADNVTVRTASGSIVEPVIEDDPDMSRNAAGVAVGSDGSVFLAYQGGRVGLAKIVNGEVVAQDKETSIDSALGLVLAGKRVFVSDVTQYRVTVHDQETLKRLYVIDHSNIKRGNPDDTCVPSKHNPDGPSCFNPHGLAYDAKDDLLYVADADNRRVVVFKSSGEFHKVIKYVGTPRGLAITPGRLLLVAEFSKARLISLKDGHKVIFTLNVPHSKALLGVSNAEPGWAVLADVFSNTLFVLALKEPAPEPIEPVQNGEEGGGSKAPPGGDHEMSEAVRKPAVDAQSFALDLQRHRAERAQSKVPAAELAKPAVDPQSFALDLQRRKADLEKSKMPAPELVANAINVVDENDATISFETAIDGGAEGGQFHMPHYVAHIPHDRLFGKNLGEAAVTKRLPWSEGVGHFILTDANSVTVRTASGSIVEPVITEDYGDSDLSRMGAGVAVASDGSVFLTYGGRSAFEGISKIVNGAVVVQNDGWETNIDDALGLALAGKRVFVSDVTQYRVTVHDQETLKRLYVIDHSNIKRGKPFDTCVPLKYDRTGNYAGPSCFNPHGLAYDAKDDLLYVADADNRRIVVFKSSGEYHKIIKCPGKPRGIAITPGRLLLVAESRKARLISLKHGNKIIFTLDVPHSKNLLGASNAEPGWAVLTDVESNKLIVLALKEPAPEPIEPVQNGGEGGGSKVPAPEPAESSQDGGDGGGSKSNHTFILVACGVLVLLLGYLCFHCRKQRAAKAYALVPS